MPQCSCIEASSFQAFLPGKVKKPVFKNGLFSCFSWLPVVFALWGH